MKTRTLLLSVIAAASLGGCALNSANQSIKQDFQGRYSCSQVDVNTLEETEGELLGVPTVRSLRMMAQGCGVNAVYTCDSTGVCVQEKADERGYVPEAGASTKVSRVPMPSGQALIVAALDGAWLVADVSQATPRITFFQSTAGIDAQKACNLSLAVDGQPVAIGQVPGAQLSEVDGCAVELDLTVLSKLAAATRVTGSVRGIALELTSVEHGNLRTFARRVNESSKALQTLASRR